MKKVLIINANYYNQISKNLVSSASKILKSHKFKIKIIDVPGVFEIPYTLRKNINKFDGYLALGCVIKGETPHFDFICRSTFDSILNISIKHSKPISNGIITAFNMAQAKKRSSIVIRSSKSNKGVEAAKALITIIKNEPKNL
tara:strand:- start:120 stop:548 length:429 start_codon:yes stop_codon:yes gene_type:complete